MPPRTRMPALPSVPLHIGAIQPQGVFGYGWLLCALLALVGGCSNDPATHRVLEAQGFTEITTQGWSLVGCAEDDWSTTRFRAVSPLGKPVNGVVCCGWFFKGCTVRW